MKGKKAAIEAAAKHIYEAKGKRLGKDFIGWNREPDHIKAEWRQDVRETIDAYERARGRTAVPGSV
jgi:hypothetical protein